MKVNRFLKNKLFQLVVILSLFNSAIADQLDRVYAIINEDVITKSEYQQELVNTRIELQARQAHIPDEVVLRTQILERMITERLQLQVAERLGITISPAQLNDTIANIARSNDTTVEIMQESLKNDGISFNVFKNRIRDQLTIQRVIERRVNSKVQISDEEVMEVVRSTSDSGINNEFHLSHIVIPMTSDVANKTQAREKIEQARQHLEQGYEFSKVAATYSKFRDALYGGDLGWRKLAELPPVYTQVLDNLEKGEFSEILQSEAAFHLIQLHDIRKPSQDTSKQMITQLRVRQIKLNYERIASVEYLRLRLQEIAEKLNNGETFADLATQYSADPESRINGGDMGWLSEGDLEPAIQTQLDRLRLGEISPVIQLDDGVSIFEIVDRREIPAGDTLAKNTAREQIYLRKADQLYQDWVQNLRDRAFIKILTDDFG